MFPQDPGSRGRQANARRGATGIAYGLVIGLIAVVAIGTTQQVGTSVERLFDDVQRALPGSGGNRTGDETSPTPLEPPPAAPIDRTGELELTVLSGNRERLEVIGPGTLVQGDSVEFNLRNTGTGQIFGFDRIEITGDDPGNFFLSHSCNFGLGADESCQLTVTAQAVSNDTFSAVLEVEANGPAGVASAGVAGIATGFAQTADPVNPTARLMLSPQSVGDVGEGLLSDTLPFALTLANVGDSAATDLKVVYQEVSNVNVSPGDVTSACGSSLAPGADCTITITATDPENRGPTFGLGANWSSLLTVSAANAAQQTARFSGFTGGQPVAFTRDFRAGFGSLGGMDVAGSAAGVEATSPAQVEIVLRVFTGLQESLSLSDLTLSFTGNSGNVEIVSDTCPPPPVSEGSALCTLSIRTKATANGAFSATLVADAPSSGLQTTVDISGTAFGFD